MNGHATTFPPMSLLFLSASAAVLALLRKRREARFFSGRACAEGLRARWEAQREKNKVFLVRHGQSEANVAKIISSDPKIGTQTHPLTGVGLEQARRAARILREHLHKGQQIIIFSSDFLRAKMTAETIATELNVSEGICISTNLRERYFGTLDGLSDENYARVWKADEDSGIFHNKFGVESIQSLLSRTVSFIMEKNAEFDGKALVFVAHGDVCQITRTALCESQVPPSMHRKRQHLETGSVTLVA